MKLYVHIIDGNISGLSRHPSDELENIEIEVPDGIDLAIVMQSLVYENGNLTVGV